MALIYVTGTPGSGKSTIQHELTRLGYIAYDLDDARFGGPFNKASNTHVAMPPIEERTPEWFDAHEWRVYREAVLELQKEMTDKVVYLCGTATTEDAIIDIFDKVIYLNVVEDTLRQRIANRLENDFGKTPHELERILARYREAQASLSSKNYEIIDANSTLNDTIEKILAIT
jgi:dephospho-CoA kinase